MVDRILSMHEPRRRDPDRLFPVDPVTRGIARDLYQRVAEAPIISPHGHVPIDWLANDTPFADPAALFVTHDHYVTRLLHASGVSFDDLGLGQGASDPREVWRLLASNWHLFAGTSSGYWLEEELDDLGVAAELCADTADETYDAIATKLALPGWRQVFGVLAEGILFSGDLDVPGVGGLTIPGAVRTHEQKPPVGKQG